MGRRRGAAPKLRQCLPGLRTHAHQCRLHCAPCRAAAIEAQSGAALLNAAFPNELSGFAGDLPEPEGSYPAEKDNAGCFFPGERETLRLPEEISACKEFCDCSFRWRFTENDAHGASIGKTLPAIASEPKPRCPKKMLTAQNAAEIPCEQVLGSYVVRLERG